MIFVMSPSITGVRSYLNSSGTMASKRAGSKDNIESAIGDAFKQVSMSLPIYEDIKMFIDKEIKITRQDINDIFSSTFNENLEDRKVYVNIHKFGLYRVFGQFSVI